MVPAMHPPAPSRPPPPPAAPSVPAADEEAACSYCCEPLDATDAQGQPCPCGDLICLWCKKRITDEFNNKCPACTRAYDDPTVLRGGGGLGAPPPLGLEFPTLERAVKVCCPPRAPPRPPLHAPAPPLAVMVALSLHAFHGVQRLRRAPPTSYMAGAVHPSRAEGSFV